jgi:four helix bundle protein
MVASYRELRAWQSAMALAEEICRTTKTFPAEERYELASQIRRAAVSVPSNIAEGWGRYGQKEFARFVGIAQGSLCELETQMLLSRSFGYISAEVLAHVEAQCSALNLLLRRLRQRLQ